MTNVDKWWERVSPKPVTEKKRWWLDVPKNTQNIVGRTRYKAKLATLQNLEDQYPNSNGKENPDLPKNKSEWKIKDKIWTEKLKSYGRFDLGKKGETTEFLDEKNIAVGHKLHLNVAIKDVQKVSDYLTDNNICHKCMNGGDIEDGKIFTIFVGSKNMADKIAKQISLDIGALLCKPIAKDEIEYAENVSGRFVGSKKRFSQYGHGLRGIPMLVTDGESIILGGKVDLNDGFDRAYEALANTYGKYFYGEGE